MEESRGGRKSMAGGNEVGGTSSRAFSQGLSRRGMGMQRRGPTYLHAIFPAPPRLAATERWP